MRRATSDYVLYGRYCETQLIQASLDELRRSTRSRAALLVATRQLLFHSLLLIDHEDPEVLERLRPALQASNYQIGHTPPWLAHAEGDLDDEDLWPALSGLLPFAALAPELDGLEVCVVSPSPSPPPNATLHPVSMLLLLFEPDLKRTGRVMRAADNLLRMVNMSAPAAVQAGLIAEQEVESRMDRLDRLAAQPAPGDVLNAGGDGLPELPAELLDAALELTSSSVGNVYLALRDSQRLQLVASKRNDHPVPEIDVDDPGSVVAWVHRRGRPLVINDVRDFERNRREPGVLKVAGDDRRTFAELAVPVHQSGVGVAGANVIGVINVEKTRSADGADGDEGHYSYRDLSVLRTLAARLSLWRTHQLLTTFSSSLTQLTRRNVLEPLPERRGAPDGVPVDTVAAHAAVSKTLKGVYEVTRSHSATVRLLSNDQQHLIRFAAHPPSRMQDAHDSIPVREHRSINAWVARSGSPCSIPNVREHYALAPFEGLYGVTESRDGTLSELCLPIFVNGRLIGTMNLESTHKQAFADAIDVAGAVVDQIGLAIQRTRLAQEQRVYSLTVATTANIHQIYRHVDRLEELFPDDHRVAEIATGLREAVASPTSIPPGTMGTAEVLRGVLKELRFTESFRWRNDPPVQVRHDAAEVFLLRIAFDELLRNAHRLSSARDCWIAWEHHEFGGSEYLAVRIANRVPRRPAPDVLERLYRAPVTHAPDGRAHIGAFLTGALLRSLGGEVYVEDSNRSQFIARIEVPVRTTAQTGTEET